MTAAAAPVERSAVMADPAWALHVDFDGLRGTDVGKQILTELNQPEQQPRFAVYKLLITFDPRTALHGVTLYGASVAPEDAVALIYADFDAERLAKLPEMAEAHQSSEHGKYTIHSWIDAQRREKSGGEPRTYAAVYKSQIVLFGQKESRLAEALDVLDETKPSLKSTERFPQFGKAAKSVIAQGFASKFDLKNPGPQTAVFKHSKQAWLELKEANEKVAGSLVLDADGGESAGQIATVLRGLVALMALQTDNPNAVKLSQALSVQAEAERATVNLSLTAADVMAMAKAKPSEK